ncbi:MAG: homocysteine S-methyltransferase family protein [FCB group bacterium]|nr:homocysteine S-methyltransferase family protein [FCB group bacterium]
MDKKPSSNLLVFKKLPVLLDGAIGTELIKRGCSLNDCLEKFAIEHPKVITEIHQAYIEAGSEIIYSATFGANRERLKRFNLAAETKNINQLLTSLARKVAGAEIKVAGSVGPTGIVVDDDNFDEVYDIFKEQMEGLHSGEVDLIVIETMTSFLEAKAAVKAVRSLSSIPAMVSFTFDCHGLTKERMTAEQVAFACKKLDVSAVGINCMSKPELMIQMISQMKEKVSLPLMAKPNAGLPKTENNRYNYPITESDFVDICHQLIDTGVSLIGGCCGTTPKYIKKLGDSLNVQH